MEADIAKKTEHKQVSKILFDSLVLAQANRNAVARGGIYRYASQLLAAFNMKNKNQDLWPFQMIPFCSDQFLNRSAKREISHILKIYNLQLQTNRHKGAITYAQPRPLKLSAESPQYLRMILKMAYQKAAKSKWIQRQAEYRLNSCIKKTNPNTIIYHTPFQAVPQLMRNKSLKGIVVTIHDMLPIKHPEFFTKETVRTFEGLLTQLQSSDHVICVSESTRRDFQDFSSCIPQDQIHITPLAADPGMARVTDLDTLNSLRQALRLQPTDKVILSLCTLEPRKNLTTLVSAFELLRQKNSGDSIKLILVGALGWKASELRERIEKSLASEAIIITGHVPECHLASLYSIADVFVYPSLYEGFGLPPLEAMQCGAPVVVGNTSSLPEVVGDAALIIDPRSPMDMATAIETLFCSAEKQEDLSNRGIAQASLFSWDHTATLTSNVYHSILNG